MEEDFDGVSVTMHQVIKRVPKDEFDVIFITPHPPKNEIDFPIYEVPYYRVPEKNKDYRFGLPKKRKDLEKILDDFDPHILHYSSPTAMGNYAVKYGNKRDKVVVSIYHTHYPSFVTYYIGFIPLVVRLVERLFYRLYKLYRKTTKILAPTEPMRTYLKTVGVGDEAISVWGRGVDTSRFNPSKRKENHWPSIPQGNNKVLFVSRLTREKEPQTLVRLYKLFADKRPDISMVIVGDGPMRAKLEKHMPDAVFMGKQTGEELSVAYASADIFVFPSTTETFGNVVLEALSSGLPVVAANAGGPSDIVENGESGFLVEPKNEQSFFDKIVELVDSLQMRKDMSEAAIAYAESQGWEKLANQLFDEYRGLVK